MREVRGGGWRKQRQPQKWKESEKGNQTCFGFPSFCLRLVSGFYISLALCIENYSMCYILDLTHPWIKWTNGWNLQNLSLCFYCRFYYRCLTFRMLVYHFPQSKTRCILSLCIQYSGWSVFKLFTQEKRHYLRCILSYFKFTRGCLHSDQGLKIKQMVSRKGNQMKVTCLNAIICALSCRVRMHFNFNGQLFGLMTKVI